MLNSEMRSWHVPIGCVTKENLTFCFELQIAFTNSSTARLKLSVGYKVKFESFFLKKKSTDFSRFVAYKNVHVVNHHARVDKQQI